MEDLSDKYGHGDLDSTFEQMRRQRLASEAWGYFLLFAASAAVFFFFMS